MSPTSALHDLLCGLFKESSLRRFLSFGEQGEAILRMMPEKASLAEQVDGAVEQLMFRGLVAVTLARLRVEFPRRRAEINVVAELWSTGTPGPDVCVDASVSTAPRPIKALPTPPHDPLPKDDERRSRLRSRALVRLVGLTIVVAGAVGYWLWAAPLDVIAAEVAGCKVCVRREDVHAACGSDDAATVAMFAAKDDNPSAKSARNVERICNTWLVPGSEFTAQLRCSDAEHTTVFERAGTRCEDGQITLRRRVAMPSPTVSGRRPGP